MRVVILCNGQSNQRALATRISAVADIAAVVVSQNIPKRKASLRKRVSLTTNAVAGRIFGRPLIQAWVEMLGHYNVEFPDFPARVVKVRNVNDNATIDTIEAERPDLVIVSGTNLVGKKVIETSNRLGRIVNLHTGISPYVRGGPNCTNWCLAKGWFDRIGNTIMWLDSGIDTGNIIGTERTVLDGSESLTELHRKVMDHGHSLYVRAIKQIQSGADVRSVSQTEVAEGDHFNSVDWSIFEIRRALLNYRNHYRNYFVDKAAGSVSVRQETLFPIEDV